MHNFGLLEARRGELQARCDAQQSQRERNERGQFATPVFLADQMAEYALGLWKDRGDRVRFLEPALGTGAMYSALRRVFPAQLVERATGVEIEKALADAATELWAETGLSVVAGDFTRLGPADEHGPYNLVLTNPPYVRHHHLARSEKSRLRHLSRAILGREVNGLTGLYCYFMLLAHDWLVPNGLGVWLVPSEFMSVNYGDTLRQYLTRNVAVLRIHRFDPQELQFDDALVSSAIVVLKKAVPDPAHKTELSYGGTLTSPRELEVVPIGVLREARKWAGLSNGAPNVVQATTPANRATLSDLFAIKRGIATGANRFFVLPRAEARERGFSDAFLRPILPSAKRLPSPIIESDRDGYPLIDRQLALIDTGLPEAQIRRLCPALWQYFREGERQGLKNVYLLAKRKPWYKQERRAPAPFLCTYMGRADRGKKPFRFFWNKSQAVAPNVYLLLYPIGALNENLRANHENWNIVFELMQRIEAAALMNEGRVYGGGLYKLEPKELGRISAQEFVEALGLRVEISLQESMTLS